MLEERFAEGDSFFHQRDPRAKLLAATMFSVTVALMQTFPPLIPAFVFSLFLVGLSGIQPSMILKRLLLINSLTLFFWITLPLTYGGDSFLHCGQFSLSLEGIRMAALITAKTNTILSALITLLATSTVADLGHGLLYLHMPRKLIFLLLYSYRYIFVIHQEYQRLLRAAKIRAFTPKTNIHTYRTYAYLFAMTLLRSHNRSQRIHQAMILRGFTGQLIPLKGYRFTSLDGLLVLSICVLCLFLIAVNLH